MAMLFLGRHRGLCHLRHHHKTVSLPYKLLHRGLKAVTCAPLLDEVVAGRRGQAQRSLLVEVVGATSVAELWRVCEGCGTVEALHHYTVPARGSVGRKEMILVEFSEASALQSALQISTHAPLKDCPPSHSPLVWLAAGRGAPTPPNNTQQPPLNLTAEGTQEELLLRLSQCSNVSEQIQTLHDGQKLTELGWRLRFFTCRQVESALSGLFPNAVVLPFGSSVNSFGHRDSDLDMTLELGGQGGKAQGGEGRLVFQVKRSSSAANPRLTLQRRMEVTADLLDHFMPGCSQVRRILNARVPIIKYRQELTAIDCDLTMANRSGYHMSRMLHLYGTADSRVVALGGAIRRWARGRGLTSPHAGRWLTNFSLTLMVLTYLMNTSPPILLPLSVLKVIPGEDEESGQPIFIVPQQSASAAAAAATKNTDPLETLLKGFFEYYDNFNFRERGMSIVTGRDFVKPAHCAIYIQNPLERDLNVSRNVTLEEVERLRSEVTHARFLLEGEEDGTETGPGTERWGALRLWLRGTVPVAQRHNEGCAIDWRAVFHPKDKAVPKGVPGNRKGTQELPGLVSKLKQKAQSKKSQNGRYTRKGKLQY